ncbi:MAG: hypothetical protein AAF515_21605 [Pseudomonadota bacterium]
MTLEDVSNIGELIGGIGVLVSLIYLAIQVRQNTLAQRAESRLAATRSWTEWYVLGAQDPEIVRIMNDGFLNPSELTSADRGRFLWMVGTIASKIEEMYSQHKAGLIDDSLWNKYRGVLAVQLENPLAKEWWDSQAAPFSDDFRYSIESTPDEIRKYNIDSLQTISGGHSDA